MTFGERIKELREDLDMTQTLFGELVGSGKNTVSEWERDIRTPHNGTIRLLANYLEVEFEWLRSGTGSKKKQSASASHHAQSDDIVIEQNSTAPLQPLEIEEGQNYLFNVRMDDPAELISHRIVQFKDDNGSTEYCVHFIKRRLTLEEAKKLWKRWGYEDEE